LFDPEHERLLLVVHLNICLAIFSGEIFFLKIALFVSKSYPYLVAIVRRRAKLEKLCAKY